jgi:hypothetical protein
MARVVLVSLGTHRARELCASTQFPLVLRALAIYQAIDEERFWRLLPLVRRVLLNRLGMMA